MERGADPNINAGGEFPYAIIAMASTGDVEGVKALIKAGADVKKYGGKYHSAILASAQDGSYEIAEISLMLVLTSLPVEVCTAPYSRAHIEMDTIISSGNSMTGELHMPSTVACGNLHLDLRSVELAIPLYINSWKGIR
jgi:hypothetical protein